MPLSFDGFFGEEKFSALPSKNNVADQKKLVQSGKFSSATLFLEGSALNFSSPKKNLQMKAGQNTNMTLQKTSGFVQNWRLLLVIGKLCITVKQILTLTRNHHFA